MALTQVKQRLLPLEMPPKGESQVQSFVCLVQYSAKFKVDVASVTKAIQELTRKEVTFK